MRVTRVSDGRGPCGVCKARDRTKRRVHAQVRRIVGVHALSSVAPLRTSSGRSSATRKYQSSIIVRAVPSLSSRGSPSNTRVRALASRRRRMMSWPTLNSSSPRELSDLSVPSLRRNVWGNVARRIIRGAESSHVRPMRRMMNHQRDRQPQEVAAQGTSGRRSRPIPAFPVGGGTR